jgi:hypothetical protein
MNYKLSKFQIGIIVFIVSFYIIFAAYTLFQNRPFTVKNISLQLIAILLIYFFINIKIAVELLDVLVKQFHKLIPDTEGYRSFPVHPRIV